MCCNGCKHSPLCIVLAGQASRYSRQHYAACVKFSGRSCVNRPWAAVRYFWEQRLPVGHAVHRRLLSCVGSCVANHVHNSVQVYVRSESSEQHQQAAKQALHDHCKPMLSEPPPPAAPLAAPHPTLGPPQQQLSLVKPCAWPFPVTASHFADAAAMTMLARDAALWEGYCAALAAGCDDGQRHVLQLLWKAAACFAERASRDDRTQRQLWSAFTAARMEVCHMLHNISRV